MGKSIAMQCQCKVWFPISQGVFNGSTLICTRCDAISRHPAGKGVANV
jgi:hypothetical protein